MPGVTEQQTLGTILFVATAYCIDFMTMYVRIGMETGNACVLGAKV